MTPHTQPKRAAWLLLALTGLVLAGLGAGRSLAAPSGAPPAQATVPAGHIVVQGQILYIDRMSERSHPAGGVKIEIWDKDYQAFSVGEKLPLVLSSVNASRSARASSAQ